MNTSNNNIRDFLMAKLEILKNWVVKNSKIVMPVVLAICVIITVVISVSANKKEAKEQEEVVASSTVEETTGTSIAVPEVALEENAYPEINELMNAYYTAMADGDIETIQTLVDEMSNTEILRIEEMSKYVESYPKLNVYTKLGPVENSYLVYACSEVKFFDYEETIPGMKVFFVCADENGKYYINYSDEENESELKYIKEVSLQDDVVDLNNRVVVAYNNMLAEDEELGQFILDLKAEIEKSVGETLAQAEGSTTTEEDAEATESDTETAENTEEGAESEPVTVVTKVKATDVVNIRSSDSETADKLGKAEIGEEFQLLEKKGNGWSKIEYEGAEAYIKSEYLEDAETMEVEAEEEETETENTKEDKKKETPESTGTVTVIENVRIRSGASEDSEKLGTAYIGQELEVIMKQADGWTKIKYNGQTAYVKSEFVE